MNWKKVPPVILSCLLAFLTGSLLGGFTGRSAGEGQMLAGGAIAVFHMLIGGLTCLGLVGYLSWKWPVARLWKLVLGLMLSFGLLAVLTKYAVAQKRAARKAAKQEYSQRTSSLSPPAVDTPVTIDTVSSTIEQIMTPDMVDRAFGEGELKRGFGFAEVPFRQDGYPLYFYADSEWGSAPVDSLVYVREDNQNVLRYAPPYLVPFYLKEDYDAHYLRLLGVSGQRVLVEVNEKENRKMWVDRSRVNLSYWPDFIAGIFSVFPLDRAKNRIRIKPLDEASEVTTISTDDFLLPQEVVGEWVRIKAMTEGDSENGPSGWLRWSRRGQLLIGWDYRL